MGHMDDIIDDNEQKYTITVFTDNGEKEIFNSCTEAEGTEGSLSFDDRNGKTHEFYGVTYHIAEE